jgi:hypothetical protein
VGCEVQIRGGNVTAAAIGVKGRAEAATGVDVKGVSGIAPLLERTVKTTSPLSTCWVQIGSMKTSIDLDEELVAEVKETVSVTREKPATVLRMAIRAGLPLVRNRLQAPRPNGYFAAAYRKYPRERLDLEAAFSKATAGQDR